MRYNHINQEERAKKKVKRKMVKGDLHLTLITLSCSDGITEYKLRNRGFSLPFAKAIAVLTPEMIDKGEMAMKCFKGNVLNLKLHDIGNFFGASFKSHLN